MYTCLLVIYKGYINLLRLYRNTPYYMSHVSIFVNRSCWKLSALILHKHKLIRYDCICYPCVIRYERLNGITLIYIYTQWQLSTTQDKVYKVHHVEAILESLGTASRIPLIYPIYVYLCDFSYLVYIIG